MHKQSKYRLTTNALSTLRNLGIVNRMIKDFHILKPEANDCIMQKLGEYIMLNPETDMIS